MDKIDNRLTKKRAKAKHAQIKKAGKFSLALRFFFIVLFIISIIYLINWYCENKRNAELTTFLNSYISVDSSDTDDVNCTIDFEGLRNINNCCFAWLKVNGTNISYPVVHYKDNDYYLTHSFDNANNSSGCPFADHRNKCDGTDKNLVIYAHNRRDGSMFAGLKNTLKKQWYSNEDNLVIELYTPDGLIKYKVFSVYEIKAENYYASQFFGTDNSYLEFLKNMKSRSIYDFNQELTANDQIITLSTCSNNNAYRTVLHAKMIK